MASPMGLRNCCVARLPSSASSLLRTFCSALSPNCVYMRFRNYIPPLPLPHQSLVLLWDIAYGYGKWFRLAVLSLCYCCRTWCKRRFLCANRSTATCHCVCRGDKPENYKYIWGLFKSPFIMFQAFRRTFAKLSQAFARGVLPLPAKMVFRWG